MLVRERSEEIERQTLSPYAQLSERTRGRAVPMEKCPIRTEYQRDRDRIVHTKAFRRLKHKTQVFLAPEGDHYRTRLTHTLEVSQIARTIARALRLNEDLTEAIALGHDLGHTPFGHSGEAILNELLPGGFRHYEQSLRVVDVLERPGGLNLTYEVRDGILNHAGTDEAETQEGRIIKLADRIAYINHDIDDAVRAGVIRAEDIPAECAERLGRTHGARIDALIGDVVAHSMDKPVVGMSEDMYRVMMQLRDFMFERVYSSKVAKAEEKKAQNVLHMLFDTFTKDPARLPEDSRAAVEEMGAERAVCDYIAGMTDNYAIYTFQRLYVPASWNMR